MFDRVVVADWSASSRPTRGRDSIWIAVGDASTGVVTTENPATRAEAFDRLAALCCGPGTVVLGVDFSLGYPAGTAESLGLGGVPWESMWSLLTEMIDDHDDNTNNRFEVAAELNRRISSAPGPFWGCPPSRRAPTLTSTKVTPAPMGEWREVEHRLRRAGHRPFSSWQLLGAGSVGGQSLVGIPRLARLREASIAAGRSVAVWPFSGPIELAAIPDVVIVEVWPSLDELSPLDGRTRDEVQVVDTARRLLGAGDLGLDRIPIPDTELRRIVEVEEGWVLGA